MKSIKKILKSEIPAKLLEIPDAPRSLYLRGEMPSKKSKLLCVVGSRKYTNYGKEVCEKLISGLRGYDISIISGLALGIDSIAHKSALQNNLKTYAFPGSGLDAGVLYPGINKKLADEIVKAGGGLISEFEPKFRATPYSFPKRNRLMAGISDAVLIIEAELKSGTLITSRLATDYNRDVLVVPGPINSKNSEGPNMLLKIGATPVTSSEDILVALGFQIDKKDKNEKSWIDCSSEEIKILEILNEPICREDLIEKVGLPASKVNTLLSILELKGLIKEQYGEIKLA
ncbi:DNA-protecting protein DprA [Candidatus Nomurabacteria bacterium]|nr:DNA-protecting protein DprA [Candidatus Nomurabacteria bacterium]